MYIYLGSVAVGTVCTLFELLIVLNINFVLQFNYLPKKL